MYDSESLMLFNKEERYRINVFDWQVEFPQVFSGDDSGFDAVIGNPPWGADFSEPELSYLRKSYSRVIDRMVDSYIYFIDRAVLVAKASGLVGFIIPSTMLNQVDARAVRKVLLTRGFSALISLGQEIFGAKVLNTSTIFVSEGRNENDTLELDDLSALPIEARKASLSKSRTVAWQAWKDKVKHDPHLTYFVGKADATALLDRLRREHLPLERVIEGKIQRGVSPDVAAAHVVAQAEAETAALETDLLRKSVSGAQIKRYRDWACDQYLIYSTKETPIKKYPNILHHLETFKHRNTCKEVVQGKHPWWALHRPRDPRIFDVPKFIGLTTSKTIKLIYDQDESAFVTDAMYVFSLPSDIDPWSCMAILQSKAFLFLYRVANQGESRVIPQIKASKLGTLPYPDVERFAPLTKVQQLCKTMLTLHRELATSRMGRERTIVQRLIAETNRQIDQRVYELYGLTDQEIAMVEEALG